MNFVASETAALTASRGDRRNLGFWRVIAEAFGEQNEPFAGTPAKENRVCCGLLTGQDKPVRYVTRLTAFCCGHLPAGHRNAMVPARLNSIFDNLVVEPLNSF
jgi:hypothetical protein